MKKPQFVLEDASNSARVATLEQAADEVDRECLVRARCFPRWVEDGRISLSDANDRFARQIRAAATLRAVLELPKDAREIVEHLTNKNLPGCESEE